MLKKMFAPILCVATALAMMPTASFGTTVQDEDVLMLQEASLQVQEELTVDGKFADEGDKYVMEDVSGYDKDMKIYCFYLGEGKYGDAFLIESNGKYLLMDAGHADSADKLVSSLKAVMKDNKKLDIYVSHVHGDHTGGLEKVMLNFDVGTVFMPDIEVCENYVTPNVGKTVDKIYIEHVAIAKTGGADRIVYLRPDSSVRPSSPRATNTYSRFNVGGALCTVMGPLGTYKPDDFINYVIELKGRCGTKEGHCINNSSLCTMVECGDAKFFATGDVEKFEEAKLVEKYGDKLDCDIMKMPHHGLRTSCSEVFAAEATPMWSFQLNHGYATGINKSAINTAKKYGYNYGVANDKHSIIFNVEDSDVRVNIDKNDNEAIDDGYLKGWIATDENKQYYDENGYITIGEQWVDKTVYHFSETSGFATAIRQLTLGTLTIEQNAYEYKGNPITPTVTVKDENGNLVDPDDYTVAYKNNNAVGTATVKVTSNVYSGELTATFTITEPFGDRQVTGLKLKKGKKKVTISWYPVSGATGYKIYRSTKKTSGFKCIKTIKSNTKKYVNKKLKSKKTYYYKVRAYVTAGGKTSYSKYSKVKSVKTK